jgi:hypothetical protein
LDLRAARLDLRAARLDARRLRLNKARLDARALEAARLDARRLRLAATFFDTDFLLPLVVRRLRLAPNNKPYIFNNYNRY